MTTDHGGEDYGHEGFNKNNRNIFLILSGDGLEAGKILPDCDVSVSHKDIFPSIMEYLGLPVSDDWGLDGRSRIEWESPPSTSTCDF